MTENTIYMLDALKKRIDHLELQLAGCLTAAEGWIENPAKPGEYGYSLAYQKVLDLRQRYEKLLHKLNNRQ